jgi:GH25 family lysozyme M1 (1,4-beta-N-acetylmuramidase)
MTDAIGIDVSKWQGAMNWSKARSAGANFAFIRAGRAGTDGINAVDERFEENVIGADSVDMPAGYYWYFRPNYDVNAQADYFCDLIKNKPRKLPLVMDLEATGNLSPTTITKRAADFALRINENVNELPMLYSRAYWLNENTVPDELLKLLELWIARYTFKGKPWGNLLPYPDLPGVKPRDYDTWVFWQWSADGNNRGAEFGASSKSIDLDYFNGDQAAFNAYIGEPPPLETHEHPEYQIRLNRQGKRITALEAEIENLNAVADKHDKDITAVIDQSHLQGAWIAILEQKMRDIGKAASGE